MASEKEKEKASTEIPPSPDSGVEEAAQEASLGFPIVGIGASAGGLAAFEAFFSAMPINDDSGMAFVLVQHLAPDHKSILSDLIKRYTRMQVFEVEDGMTVNPNTAYIIPPNRDMTFVKGKLHLVEPAAPRGQRLPIDLFFRSLAKDQRERAVCIVLSGTGSDGTAGVRAVKAEGGIAMAQNPESTEYDGMPRNAIATGLVDYVLPPAEMPAQLIAYSLVTSSRVRPSDRPNSEVEDEFKGIFELLRTRTGHDFSLYKQNTIRRRVERRMAVQHVEDLGGYLQRLQETPAEVDALFRDLLIGVTSFFRDPEAFAVLENRVIARLIAEKGAQGSIRVWVPGCSTGEEAYSIAILLQEKVESLKQHMKVQVFATDIDPRAIDVARAGVYPGVIATDITPERLTHYFAPIDDGNYRVHKSVRDLLVFSEQDVTKDPPFSKLDLISCRNLMIYMGPELQKKLIPLFHYALNPAGALFLGTSETVGDFGGLFATTDRKAKLYQRKDDVVGGARPSLGSIRPAANSDEARPSVRRLHPEGKLPLREIAERVLLQSAPVAALVDASGDLLYLHGRTGDYLEPAPGEAGMNILKMARDGLRHELTSALYRAKTAKERVRRPGLRIKNAELSVNLTVQPVPPTGQVTDASPLFLVTFEPGPRLAGDVEVHDAGDGAGGHSDAEEARVQALRHELQAKDEFLQATQEEMQTSNEELRSSNEELQSTNEELQSTNEELETSKEELQSVNEELATVNAELQSKVSDLSVVNNDMSNLLASTGIGTVFVDQQMRIRRFTPAVTPFINLIQTDVGRPLAHIASNLVGYDRLISDVKAVLDTLKPESIEVQTGAGATYLLRIRPYRTTENAVEGAVITFTEVTGIKDTVAALRQSDTLRDLAGAARDATDAITVQDLEGRILAWNPGAVRMYGWTESEALAMNVRALVPPQQMEQALALIERIGRAEVLQPYRTQRVAKGGKIVEVTLTAAALVNATGTVYALSTTERGMTN